MESYFRYSPNEYELAELNKFCDSADNCAIEQCPGWPQLFYHAGNCFYYLRNESGIIGFCQISESFRSANIEFGPVCNDNEIMLFILKEIVNHYKSKGYFYLGVQMLKKSGYETDYLEYQLSKSFRIKYIFDNYSTKSSLEIDLANSNEEIFHGYRKGHKSDIKKAQRLGITVENPENEPDLKDFARVYTKMCSARKLDEVEINESNIIKINNYLESHNRGSILLVRDSNRLIIGGIILVYQGTTVRYFKGTSDPDIKELPVLHIALHEAIIKAKNEGFRYFDFWGINHFAGENSQAYAINHFKKGFGGYYTFFAKRMHIELVPCGYRMFRTMSSMRRFYHRILPGYPKG